MKRTGERSAGKPPAPFDVAGAGDGPTAGLLRHSQRKRGATDRPSLRGTAPILDPTGGGGRETCFGKALGPYPTRVGESSHGPRGSIRNRSGTRTTFCSRCVPLGAA